MNRIPDKTPLMVLGFVVALIMLTYIAGRLAWGMEQVTVYGKAEGAPWYVTLLIVATPGIAAVLLTVASGVMTKRINRAMGNDPLSVVASIKWTLAFGMLWGPLVAWGFGEMVFVLTGVMTSWKMIVVAPAITGIASMIAYDMLRWYTQKRYPGLYALLSVKHRKAAGHTGGNGDDGDLTFYTAQGADDTIPRD